MPTHQDETLPQRYAREHQDYLKLCGSMTAEQVADIQLQLHNSLAREQALQQRLNAADQRIDELTTRVSEHPEGKRERFEKWVMATRHPVFGFLDGRSLARGDDRTGYADEYVQGLWVAYQAFGGFASRDESIGWLKRIDGIGQNRAELIYSMGFRRLAD